MKLHFHNFFLIDLPIEASFKEMLSDDLQSLRIILDIVQSWIVGQQIGENIQEKLQWILIQIVDLVEVVNGEVDAWASTG